MGKTRDVRRLRNLAQYKNMSEEEFDEAMNALMESDYEEDMLDEIDTFEERWKSKMDEFERHYDLSDMKYNDTETLIVLCKALVTLEDYDNILVTLRSSSMGDFAKNLTIVDKISNISSNLRRDVSKLQDDLKISRKIRKATREESARAELLRLKELARKKYEKVHSYVYCEECNMLIGTAWFNYPYLQNKVAFQCGRVYYDDEGNETGRCEHVTTISSEKLMELKGTNHPDGFIF